MDFNFPLFLVIAVFVTGLVWLLEIFYLRPRRPVLLEEGDEGQQPLFVEYSISFFPVLLLVLVLRSFLYEPFQIPSGSMIPTLEVGDFILVNKYTYGIRLPVTGTKVIDMESPKRGDVMVFIPPHDSSYFIKRVVGLPGDQVRYINKVLYVNGKEQEQSFVARLPPASPRYTVQKEKLGEQEHLIHLSVWPEGSIQEWQVPEGKYFVMGDNRDKSADSRSWGFVSEENIVGRAVAVWMNWRAGFRLPDFSRNGAIE